MSAARNDCNAVRALAERQDDLLARFHQFNFRPAEYADSSWFTDAAAQPVLAALLSSPRGARRLSERLLNAHSVPLAGASALLNPAHRLALFDTEFLQRLMRYAGAALQADRIAHIIEAPKVRALRLLIGEEVVYFALRRAPFLFKPAPELIARRPLTGGEPEALARDIETAGQDCLEVCLARAPAGLTQRLAFKFPVAREWRFAPEISPVTSDKAWNLLRLIATKELASNFALCLS